MPLPVSEAVMPNRNETEDVLQRQESLLLKIQRQFDRLDKKLETIESEMLNKGWFGEAEVLTGEDTSVEHEVREERAEDAPRHAESEQRECSAAEINAPNSNGPRKPR